MRTILIVFYLSILFFISSDAFASYECDRKTVKGKDYEKEIIVYCGEAKGFTLEKIENQKTLGTDFVLKYGEKTVFKLNNSNYLFVGIDKAFEIKGNKVLLMGFSSGGNLCPRLYRFITVRPDGTAKVTEEFGNCIDEITVSQKDDTIIVTMPKIRGKGMETYIYRNGDLVKGDKPKRK